MKMNEIGESLRTKGNEAYLRKDLKLALKHYTASAEHFVDHRTFGNRSQIHFELENFGDAYLDASFALVLDPINTKHQLRQKNAELKLFERAGKLSHPSTDFLGAVQVCEIQSQGRGLVASRDLLPGELIAICSPLVVVRDANHRLDALQKLSTMILTTSDEYIRLGVNDLDDGGDGDSLDVREILKRNAFELTPNKFGLFHMASFINHACACNSLVVFLGEMLVIRAATHIPSQSQVTIQYFSTLGQFVIQRQEYIKTSWGFTCACLRCEMENRDSICVDATIDQLCSEFFTLVKDSPNKEDLILLQSRLKPLVSEQEARLAELKSEQPLWGQANLATSFQVLRAIHELLGDTSEASRLQDKILTIENAIEPGSIEHCKACMGCLLFCEAVNDTKRQERIRNECIRVHALRYGGTNNPLLLTKALQETRKAMEAKKNQEWTLYELC